jgi:hypothetical protein
MVNIFNQLQYSMASRGGSANGRRVPAAIMRLLRTADNKSLLSSAEAVEIHCFLD